MREIRPPTKEEEKILQDNYLSLFDEKGARNFSVLNRDKNTIELLNHKSGCRVEIVRGTAVWY